MHWIMDNGFCCCFACKCIVYDLILAEDKCAADKQMAASNNICIVLCKYLLWLFLQLIQLFCVDGSETLQVVVVGITHC